MIITIDGPSGSGKSSVASGLAKRLGFTYLDTGAMYRAVTVACIEKGIDAKDVEALRHLLEELPLRIDASGGQVRYYLGDHDVTERLRSVEVTRAVSRISAVSLVREALVQMQRELGKGGNIVVEGRDMGTHVFPNAQCKFFLIASSEARAHRRYLEMVGKDEALAATLSEKRVLEEQEVRDAKDSTRALSPLHPASDALEVDTTQLTLEEVIDLLYAHVKGRDS